MFAGLLVVGVGESVSKSPESTISSSGNVGCVLIAPCLPRGPSQCQCTEMMETGEPADALASQRSGTQHGAQTQALERSGWQGTAQRATAMTCARFGAEGLSSSPPCPAPRPEGLHSVGVRAAPMAQFTVCCHLWIQILALPPLPGSRALGKTLNHDVFQLFFKRWGLTGSPTYRVVMRLMARPCKDSGTQ